MSLRDVNFAAGETGSVAMVKREHCTSCSLESGVIIRHNHVLACESTGNELGHEVMPSSPALIVLDFVKSSLGSLAHSQLVSNRSRNTPAV